jgi:hypothetical protein
MYSTRMRAGVKGGVRQRKMSAAVTGREYGIRKG